MSIKQDRVEPMVMTIADASRYAGMTRSEIYRRLSAGDITAVKNGKRTLVVMESLRTYLTSLPQATFRIPSESAAT